MEQLIQKYSRYFYMALIGGVSIELIDITVMSLQGCMCFETIILMFLSTVNIMLLVNTLKHNIKQQFTECKEDAKLLRFTIALFIAFQSLLCFQKGHDWVMFANHLMTVVLIEIILNYRIKSIEHLEKLASKFAKENALDQEKGE